MGLNNILQNGIQDSNFNLPGSGTVYPLLLTAVRCYVWADVFGPVAAYKGQNTILVSGCGTDCGRSLYCNRAVDIFTASDYLSETCNSRSTVEFPIAKDAVVLVINRNHPYIEIRGSTVNLPAGQACTLLESENPFPSVSFRANRYLPTLNSGTARFVGRRLCGDETALLSLKVSPQDRRTEDYETGAASISNDPIGVGILPFRFYSRHRDRLVAIGIDDISVEKRDQDGIKPNVDKIKPGKISEEGSTCA
jgi:ABC-type phosphate transport system substrate-binding protein